MTALLKLYWRPLALITLVALSLWLSYRAGFRSADVDWQLRWSRRDLSDSTAALHRDIAERAEELRRQDAVESERKRADEELAKVQSDANAAERARLGLQQQLKNLQQQLAGSETSRLSTAAAASAAKAQAGILLAKLLSEADDMAGKFAKEADERYVAGASCERTYGKVIEEKDSE